VLAHEIKLAARAEGDPVVEERTYWYADDGFSPAAHRDVRRDEAGVQDEGWVHYVHDPIGTPERLVNGRGEIIGGLRRSAWGRTETTPGSLVTTPMRFQGQYEDVETGLHYSHFRYYDPDTARFISQDPIGFAGGLNLFRYPENPTGRIDPFGLAGCQCVLLTKHGPFRSNTGSPSSNHALLKPTLAEVNPTQEQKDATNPPTQHEKGQCAEPHVLTKYFDHLRENEGWSDEKIMTQGLADIEAIVPMEKTGDTAGQFKEPCAYCSGKPGSGGMLERLGLGDKVKYPEQLPEKEQGIVKGKL
jgi:RHS repeat-associated protein